VKKKINVAILLWLTVPCLGQAVHPKHIETPTYPGVAAAGRAQGKVSVRVTLDAEGRVTKAEVENAHQVTPALEESSVDNIKRWTFERPTSAPFTLVIVYEYKMDGSLPVNNKQNPITRVNFDLPDHVTILHNETAVNPQVGKKPKSSGP